MNKLFFLIFGVLIFNCYCEENNNLSSFLSKVSFRTENILRNCFISTANNTTSSMTITSCLRKQSLLILQRTMDQNIISLGDSIKLIKWENNTIRSPGIYDKIENIKNLTYDTWKNEMFKAVSNVFETHIIKIKVDDKNISNTEAEGRRRKKGYMEFYIFSIVALGTVMVPMGFKFLAVLGGKAILLAKMALLLASIQGLKKLATSDINYGLYQTPPVWYGYDRKSQEDHYQHYPEDYYNQNYPSAPNYPYVKRIAN